MVKSILADIEREIQRTLKSETYFRTENKRHRKIKPVNMDAPWPLSIPAAPIPKGWNGIEITALTPGSDGSGVVQYTDPETGRRYHTLGNWRRMATFLYLIGKGGAPLRVNGLANQPGDRYGANGYMPMSIDAVVRNFALYPFVKNSRDNPKFSDDAPEELPNTITQEELEYLAPFCARAVKRKPTKKRVGRPRIVTEFCVGIPGEPCPDNFKIVYGLRCGECDRKFNAYTTRMHRWRRERWHELNKKGVLCLAPKRRHWTN